MIKEKSYEKYWDQNISKWGDLYLDISHGQETLTGNRAVAWIYNRIVVPYEANLMKIRYKKTIEFIKENVGQYSTVNDIGCGTGIFSVECLLRGAKVNALDLSQSSLDQTKKNIESVCAKFYENVKFVKCDLQEIKAPQSDCTICVGVLPYIDDVEAFLQNILMPTEVAFIQFSEKSSPSNIVRRLFPFLNVRRLKFQSEAQIISIAKSLGHVIVSSEKFATGRLLTFQKVA